MEATSNDHCRKIELIFATSRRTYNSYEEAEKDFVAGHLYPEDLKKALAKTINELLQPVRDHFEKDPQAKELLKLVRSYRVIYLHFPKKTVPNNFQGQQSC